MVNTSGSRNKKQVLKTARGRSNSSANWLRRHINDPYVALAKQHSYRSRAAFKLLEIHERFKIFRNALSIIDLGAAPGSWLQVVIQKCKKDARILAIDLNAIEKIENVHFIRGDIADSSISKKAADYFDNIGIDLIISDMACNASGDASTDMIRNAQLLEIASNFALTYLNKRGNFVAKILHSGGKEMGLIKELSANFETVKLFKPKASYSNSKEQYIIALNKF